MSNADILIPTIVRLYRRDKAVLIEALERVIASEQAEEQKGFNANYTKFHKQKKKDFEHVRDLLKQYDGLEFTR